VKVLLADDNPDRAGIAARVPLRTQAPDVKPILRAAAARNRRNRLVPAGQQEIETQSMVREIADRTKSLLVGRGNLAEPEAYCRQRTQAMTRERLIVDIATDLVRDGQREAP
jgi:AmiR/NasT family two-component response regulator